MAEVVRRGGLAVKIPKNALAAVSTEEKVVSLLRDNPEDAYTVNGILMEGFDVEPENLRGTWVDWPGKLPTQYAAVRRVLDRLHSQGKVTKKKRGKAIFWAWKEKD
jgi:hypothetical protein